MSLESTSLQDVTRISHLFHLRRVIQSHLQQRLSQHLDTAAIVNQVNHQALLSRQLHWQDLASLQHQFFQQMQLFPNLSGIQWGTCEGNYVGVLDLGNRTPTLEIKDAELGDNKYVFALNDAGHRTATQLGRALAYDPRQRPWYKRARGCLQWSQVYQYASDASVQLGVMATLGVFEQGQLLGVLGCDLALTHISDLLAQLSQETCGTYCIIERNGALIGSSVHSRPFEIADQRAVRIMGQSCGSDILEAAINQLLQHGDLAQLQTAQDFQCQIGEHLYWIDVQPMPASCGLDWLVVSCLSAQDLLQSADSKDDSGFVDALAVLKQNNHDLLAQVRHNAQALQASNQALQRSEERWQLALQGTNDGLWDWHIETNEVFFSERWLQIAGYRPGEVAYHFAEWEQRIHPDDRPQVLAAIRAHLEQQEDYYVIEHRTRCKDGSYKWVLDRGRALWDAQNKPVRMVGSRSDITARKQMEARLIVQAEHDSLTGVYNRSALMQRLDYLRESEGRDFVLFFIDIDRFKAVNDSLGHTVGDQLLISFAFALKQILDEQAFVARLSGDEFVLLIERSLSSSDILQAAWEVKSSLQKVAIDLNLCTPVAPSIGVTSTKHSSGTPQDFLRDADIAMYAAKHTGGNQMVEFTPTLREQSIRTLWLESALKQAVDNQEFSLYFQPILCLERGLPISLEALIRWAPPHSDAVSPAEFIPLAEKTGLILPIGSWVLERVCQYLSEWQTSVPELAHLSVNVNVSMQQFYQRNFVDSIDRLLNKYQLKARQLRLEITESCFMESVELAISNMYALQRRQIPLCIDDFGTGYSSLSYIHQLPVESLKIDRSFVSRLTHGDEGTAMVKAILAISRSLGIQVVAEGIETSEQFQKLQSLGCHLGQGYLFAKPDSALHIAEWVRHSCKPFDVQALLSAS